MKISDILLEGQNTKILLVDFQPAYYNATSSYIDALETVIEYLNKVEPHNVMIFYNGIDVGIEDTQEEVLYHYIEHGLEEDVAQNFKFREKGYAFFRSWMDEGMEPGIIIKVIRHMAMTRNNDSRDIEPKEMIKLIGQNEYDEYESLIENDPIYIPDINIAELKTFSGALMGGGGEHECLREIQILMSAFNIRYRIVRDWTY